jgi:phosphoribosyl 1,2-cyclic phosphate phosphodiesterase
MDIQTFLVDHGSTTVVGLRVGSFAYITDVNHIPEAAQAHLHDLETLVLDAVRYEPHPNHFHYERAIEVASALGAKRTILTHLSHDYDHDKTNAELPKGFELAFDRQRIQIR